MVISRITSRLADRTLDVSTVVATDTIREIVKIRP